MKNEELNIIDCAPLNLKAQGVYFQENSNVDYCTPETFKRGDAVCFKSHPSIRIGTISEDSGDSVHVFTSDDYFKEFAPYGGPNTLTVRKDSIQLFDNQNTEEPLPVFIQESNVQELKYQWHRFDINDHSTYPPKKGNYIVSYHFPEDFDFNIEDYTGECTWAEYMNGALDWSPRFEWRFVMAWTYLPEPFKN